MKMIYLIVGLVIIGGVTFYLVSSKSKGQASSNLGQTPEKKLKDNPYEGLRTMAFSASPEQLGLQIPSDQTQVYGIIMDWDIGDAIVTIVSFQTGDASVYISTGQAFIGGSGHETVRTAAIEFVRQAQNYLSNSKKTDSNSLPDKEFVKFYLLTNNGNFVNQETARSIENRTSDWTSLFEYGNNVLTEYRLVNEKMEKN